ncbi:MAG: amino acid ABC transporter substrate-binding protein [Gammaproteobacteria bacterium]|nr:amino acid ABC transporter substrate-binding protein [Gammaproteobacteria bacterium]NIR85049.1 amino acid ABC transporter substrate-binding protein [Gammaproteobacteria bacterium]NIR88316.1 amino acid ABC transporter substrate-binding protein [Gammaproteobacteria bacterium]NIU06096.1 amino acid ABC transporter substrate-binding protein [Gammaproteobacteria bacterium]NIV73515.1 ABC transporter substrate-binding protein [Gammaproteobacteria bacterium]
MTRRISRRRFLTTSALGAGALSLGAPAIRTRAAAPTVKCGVITSLSGPTRFGGNLTRRGYDLWAEEINKRGGVEIGGTRYEVEMFYGDAQSKPSSGADAAERLIVQEDVNVLFGPYTSGVTLAVQPISAKYRVPMISGSAESPNVWLAKPPFNFGMIPAVDLTAGKSIGVVTDASDPRPTTAAVVGVNEPFSKETAEGFRAGVAQTGLKLTSYELIPAKADLTPIVSSLKSQNPDIVAVGAHEEVLINFVKTAKSLRYRPKALLMHYGVTVPAFADQLGADADGVLGISLWTPKLPYRDDLFGTATEYDDLSHARWGSHPDYTEAACSASGLVLQDAAKRLAQAPPWDQSARQALAQAIEGTDIDTFYGPVAFEKQGDHYHNNTRPVPVVIQIKQGRVVPVAPADAAEGEYTYPLPAWS